MLEHIFGSHCRVKLLRLFLLHPENEYFVREITRLLNEQINSVRRELGNLENIGLVRSTTRQFKKYYRVQPEFLLYSELRGIILKSRLTSEKKFLASLKGIGQIQYLALFGYFVEDPAASVDLLLVGKIKQQKLVKLLEKFSDDFGQKLRYTIMDLAEYRYRAEITDKFLYDILSRKKIIVLDQLK